MNESFYDWCVKNNHRSFILLWDYSLNKKTPQEVTRSDIHNYFFKCPRGIHYSEQHSISTVTRHGKIPKCSVCNSFGQWCVDNKRVDLLKRWDKSKNEADPFSISISSTKKQYFICQRGLHESELKDLNNIRKQFGSGRCKACESIAQFGIDNVCSDFISKYWSAKNTENPYSINRYSNKKVWFKCTNTDYHDDYLMSAVNFQKGKRCPYCSSKKVCLRDSLLGRYPECTEYWYERKISPADYFPSSGKSVYWKCGIHGLYKRKIIDMVNAGFVCPKCARERKNSRLQSKVSGYLNRLFRHVLHEYDCNLKPVNPSTGRILPFDNEVVDINLIVEVNGRQHYTEGFYKHFGKKTPKEDLENRKKIDEFKKEFAICNGYEFLEIPYWADDKQNTWKNLIDQQLVSMRI